jgi:hypothetical protein
MCTDILEDPAAIYLGVVNFQPGVYDRKLQLQLVTLDIETFMSIFIAY